MKSNYIFLFSTILYLIISTETAQAAKELKESYKPSKYSELTKADLDMVEASLLSGVAMLVDNTFAIVKSKKVQIDARDKLMFPFMLHDTIYVPLIFINKTFGCNISNIAGTRLMNGKNFAPVENAAKIIGKKLFRDERGLIIFADDVTLYENEVSQNLNSRRKFANEIANWITFDRPSETKIKNDFLKTNCLAVRPRLLLTNKKLEEIKKLIVTDLTAKTYYEAIIQEANTLLKSPPLIKLERHTIHNRIKVLGLAYKLTKDKRYAESAWKDIEFQCNAPDWMPNEAFDLAYLCKGIANAYDIYYDYMTPEQRNFTKNAMITKGLDVYYEGYKQTPQREGSLSHLFVPTNHNVTLNCGAITIALALMDEKGLTNKCAYIISSAISAIENYLPEYLMFGSCKEGVYYWYWPMESLVETVTVLDANFGRDYGITSIPGFKESGYFPVYMTGPTGMAFNWGNAIPKYYISSEELWLGERFGDAALPSVRVNALAQGKAKVNPYDLIYYNPKHIDTNNQLPKDKMFRGTESVGMFGNMDSNEALYVAIKGGYNNAIHTSLSAGSFVLDALGKRWACLIGHENYNVPKYWDYNVNGIRWTYYRMRAEGQNALILNPSNNPDQYPLAYCKIENYQTKPNGSYAIVDLTPAFYGDSKITSAKRGAFLTENRSKVIIQDEVEAKNSTYYFMMQTQSNINILKDTRSAILELDGKKLFVNLQSTENRAQFSIMEAKPLPTSPNPKENSENTGIRKLVVKLENINKLIINLTFSPSEIETLQSPIVEMSNWKIE